MTKQHHWQHRNRRSRCLSALTTKFSQPLLRPKASSPFHPPTLSMWLSLSLRATRSAPRPSARTCSHATSSHGTRYLGLAPRYGEHARVLLTRQLGIDPLRSPGSVPLCPSHRVPFSLGLIRVSASPRSNGSALFPGARPLWLPGRMVTPSSLSRRQGPWVERPKPSSPARAALVAIMRQHGSYAAHRRTSAARLGALALAPLDATHWADHGRRRPSAAPTVSPSVGALCPLVQSHHSGTSRHTHFLDATHRGHPTGRT